MNMMICEKHGEQRVVEWHPFTGFAGGSSSAAMLACGCTILDQDADVRAAF